MMTASADFVLYLVGLAPTFSLSMVLEPVHVSGGTGLVHRNANVCHESIILDGRSAYAPSTGKPMFTQAISVEFRKEFGGLPVWCRSSGFEGHGLITIREPFRP